MVFNFDYFIDFTLLQILIPNVKFQPQIFLVPKMIKTIIKWKKWQDEEDGYVCKYENIGNTRDFEDKNDFRGWGWMELVDEKNWNY